MLLWCISFKIVPFWLNTPTPTVFPLLETFLEFFFLKCVKDALRICLDVFNRVKSLPFQWKFQFRKQVEVRRGIGWLWKHRNFEFGQKFNDWEGTVGRDIVVVEHPTPVFPQCRPFLPHLFAQTLKDTFVVFLVNCLSCRGKFMMHNTGRIEKKSPTLSSPSTDFAVLFSVVVNLESSTAKTAYPYTHDSSPVITLFNKSGSFLARLFSSWPTESGNKS